MPFRAIHCADIHLGSKMETKLPKEKADERRAEVRRTFSSMAEYAREHEVPVILLSGDVFDSDSPFKKDKAFFYNVVKEHPEIDFLYLRGNHDNKESYTEQDIPNLKTFGKDWTYYCYGDVVVSGIELAPENAVSLYSVLRLNPGKKNVVMLHGQITETMGNPETAEPDTVYLPRLRGKNIDYLALGHLHSYREGKLDERGIYAYSGCLEGRGFDETGKKGFVLLEIGDAVRTEFVPFAKRTIKEERMDISGTENAYQACQKIRAELKTESSDLLRILLTGAIDYENDGLAQEIEGYLAPDFYFVSVKDKTMRKLNLEALSVKLSLKGEFIRTVFSSSEYSEEEKLEIISAGLRALEGQEVE